MREREGTHLEQTPQQPKSWQEHRVEFTERYSHLWRPSLDSSWINENGEERIGRVYCYNSQSVYEIDKADRFARFLLKARQAGFDIIDKTDFPSKDEKYITHQFTFEGKPLPTSSPQSQMP